MTLAMLSPNLGRVLLGSSKNWARGCSNDDKVKEVEMDLPPIGHTLRKEWGNTTRMAMDWNPQGRRKGGRPKQSWRRTVIKELENIGRTLAKNRVRWKAMVEALCLSRGKED